MALTSEQIAKLASKKGVRAIAVENFLGSLGSMSATDAYSNVQMDARLYKWNAATQAAIRQGIKLHFKGEQS